MPGDIYDFMVEVSKNSRQFFPLSSVYMQDPLSVVLLAGKTEFPSGPMQVPAGNQPSLRLEWSMTTWVAYERYNMYSPTNRQKKLIVRRHLPDDDPGRSCWGWYIKVPAEEPLCLWSVALRGRRAESEERRMGEDR